MSKRLLPLLLLFAYSALLFKIMVLRDLPLIRIGHLMFNFGGGDANGQANFVPFRTIWPYLFGYKGWIIAGVNLVGNVAALVPVGLLIPLTSRNTSWKRAALFAILAGAAIEGAQVVLRTGIFDIDDLILNGLGVMVGYFLCILFIKFTRPRFSA